MVECEGVTLGDALRACVEKDPRLQPRIFRENGAVWPGVFVNGRNSRQLGGLDARLSDGDTVTVVPPISGG